MPVCKAGVIKFRINQDFPIEHLAYKMKILFGPRRGKTGLQGF